MKRNKKNIFRISFGWTPCIISLNLPAEGDMSPSLQVLHILCMQSLETFIYIYILQSGDISIYWLIDA